MAATYANQTLYSDIVGTNIAASVAKPPGVVSGTLVVAQVTIFVGSGSRTIDLPTGGSTWIAAGTQQSATVLLGGAVLYYKTFYKIAGGSEPSNYGFSWDAAATAYIEILSYDGVDGTTPYQASSQVYVTPATGTAITLPSITTANANALLVGFVYDDGGTGSTTYSSGVMTERFDATVGGYDTIQASAGASGTKLITAAASGTYCGTMLAFNSATGGGTAYTLTAAVGAFALAGVATARLLSMASGLGAFALVGASSTSGYGMNAAPGTVSLTGIAATLVYTPASGPIAYTLTSALGTFALAGQAALFPRAIKVVSDVGTFTLQGQSANLSWSAEVLAVNTAWRNLLGFTVSQSDSRLATIFVDDNTTVPAASAYSGGAAFTPGGRAYVCNYPSGGSAPQRVVSFGGRSYRSDGAMVINSVGGTPVVRKGGMRLTALGELIVDTGAPVRFPNGVGTSETGVVSVSHTS